MHVSRRDCLKGLVAALGGLIFGKQLFASAAPAAAPLRMSASSGAPGIWNGSGWVELNFLDGQAVPQCSSFVFRNGKLKTLCAGPLTAEEKAEAEAWRENSR